MTSLRVRGSSTGGGVYSISDPEIAEEYAQDFKYRGKRYMVIL